MLANRLAELWFDRTMLRALLFDFDGLLLDTEAAAYRSWSEVYEQFGVALPLSIWVHEVIGRSAGATTFDPVTYLEQRTGAVVDRQEVLRLREEHKARLSPTELLPGIARLLEEAREAGVSSAIVTSEYRERVIGHLERIGVTHPWDAIVCADGEAERGKPSPVLYLEALEQLAIDAGQAIAFEDSPNGVQAAKAAGVFCVAVPNDLTRDAPGLEAGDLLLESLSSITLSQLVALSCGSD